MSWIEDDITLWHKQHPGKFESWVDTCKDLVYNTALGMLMQETDAEDIVQEVFIALYQKCPAFREEAKISTWLYRITVNKCIDVQRKHKRKVNRLGKWENANDEEIFHFEHPGVLTENKEHAKVLFAALRKIPDDQRAAYVLQKMEDKSMQEIAEILERSVSAVESLLSRANQNLRIHLKHYYETQLK